MGKIKIQKHKKNKACKKKYKYGLYKPKNTLSTDQVPYQSMHVKKTIAIRGSKRVHMRKSKLRKQKRFCTLNVTVRAEDPQIFKLMIIYKGTPIQGDASIAKTKRLREESKHFDPRGLYAWDKNSYLTQGPAKVWYEHINSVSATDEDRLIQMDGYKTLLTRKWRNQFKRDRFKQVISPADCTDASTSVVDEHIGQALKSKISQVIDDLELNGPELFEKIETEGLGFFRIQFSKIACQTYKDLLKTMDIPSVFKACGLCNDIDGKESHLIKCGNLISYKAPTKDTQRRLEPYSQNEIRQFYLDEIEAVQNRKRKKCLRDELQKTELKFRRGNKKTS